MFRTFSPVCLRQAARFQTLDDIFVESVRYLHAEFGGQKILQHISQMTAGALDIVLRQIRIGSLQRRGRLFVGFAETVERGVRHKKPEIKARQCAEP